MGASFTLPIRPVGIFEIREWPGPQTVARFDSYADAEAAYVARYGTHYAADALIHAVDVYDGEPEAHMTYTGVHQVFRALGLPEPEPGQYVGQIDDPADLLLRIHEASQNGVAADLAHRLYGLRLVALAAVRHGEPIVWG